MIRNYSEEEQLAIRDRRLERIELIQDNCPNICWTDLVMWAIYAAPGYHGNTVILNRAKDCRFEYPTCYCGRFSQGKDARIKGD